MSQQREFGWYCLPSTTSQGICTCKILNTEVLLRVCLFCLCLSCTAGEELTVAVLKSCLALLAESRAGLRYGGTESDLWAKLLNVHTSAGTCRMKMKFALTFSCHIQ